MWLQLHVSSVRPGLTGFRTISYMHVVIGGESGPRSILDHESQSMTQINDDEIVVQCVHSPQL